MPRLIYVLKNKAMLGLVKIGLTTDSRISNLSSSTGVALSFECNRPAKSSTQLRKAKTWCALKFKWAPVLAF